MKIHIKAIVISTKEGEDLWEGSLLRCEMLGAQRSWLSFQEAELDKKRKMT